MTARKGRQTVENRAKATEFRVKNGRKGRICVLFKANYATAAKTIDVYFGKSSLRRHRGHSKWRGRVGCPSTGSGPVNQMPEEAQNSKKPCQTSCCTAKNVQKAEFAWFRRRNCGSRKKGSRATRTGCTTISAASSIDTRTRSAAEKANQVAIKARATRRDNGGPLGHRRDRISD